MLSENLKLARKEAGLSSRDVCYELGITKGTLSKWENGSKLITEERLEQLADLYDMEIEELMYGVIR